MLASATLSAHKNVPLGSAASRCRPSGVHIGVARGVRVEARRSATHGARRPGFAHVDGGMGIKATAWHVCASSPESAAHRGGSSQAAISKAPTRTGRQGSWTNHSPQPGGEPREAKELLTGARRRSRTDSRARNGGAVQGAWYGCACDTCRRTKRARNRGKARARPKAVRVRGRGPRRSSESVRRAGPSSRVRWDGLIGFRRRPRPTEPCSTRPATQETRWMTRRGPTRRRPYPRRLLKQRPRIPVPPPRRPQRPTQARPRRLARAAGLTRTASPSSNAIPPPALDGPRVGSRSRSADRRSVARARRAVAVCSDTWRQLPPRRSVLGYRRAGAVGGGCVVGADDDGPTALRRACRRACARGQRRKPSPSVAMERSSATGKRV